MQTTEAPQSLSECDRNWNAVSLVSGPMSKQSARIAAITSLREMREHLAATWALHKHQISPDFDWRTWVLLGGRGSGKTCAGAAWIADLAKRPNLTLALVGPALHDVREVMIEGPSGVMTLAESRFELTPLSSSMRWGR